MERKNFAMNDGDTATYSHIHGFCAGYWMPSWTGICLAMAWHNYCNGQAQPERPEHTRLAAVLATPLPQAEPLSKCQRSKRSGARPGVSWVCFWLHPLWFVKFIAADMVTIHRSVGMQRGISCYPSTKPALPKQTPCATDPYRVSSLRMI